MNPFQEVSIQKNKRYDSKRPLNIMLREKFTSSFEVQYWKEITCKENLQFINEQTKIVKQLMKDKNLFSQYFLIFYNNHVQINNWYMLANENQATIKKYVFRNLLSKTFKEYREEMKERCNDILINPKCNQRSQFIKKYQTNNSFHKIHVSNSQSTNQLKQKSLFKREQNLFFEKSHKKIYTKDLSQNTNCQRLSENNLNKVRSEDYHQLFVQTLNACDGSKYIFYDFNKHMKGIQSMKKYNEYIRNRKNYEIKKFNLFNQNARNKQNHEPQAEVNKQSIYLPYFHEKEVLLQDKLVSKYILSPIGQVHHKIQNKSNLSNKKNVYFRKNKSQHFGKIKIKKLSSPVIFEK